MSQRSNQVAEELRKIISMIFIQDLSDPEMGFVTITRIEMTDDLRFARVFYSVLGDAKQIESTQEALRHNMGFIKKLAIQRINMRYAPELKFELDESIAHGQKVDEILRKLKKEEK